MKTAAKTIAIILLLLNGIGAVYGGFQFITDPSGAKLQITVSFLEHSPFNDFLIPGIILIIVNGVFSFIALATLIMKTTRYYLFTIAQGVLLTGWIIIQMLLLRMFYAPMHATFIIVGLCLIGCGLYLKRSEINHLYQ